jgi:hypothetical protein
MPTMKRQLVSKTVEGFTERETFVLVGGPREGTVVSIARPAQEVTLTLRPEPGWPVPIVYAYKDGELRYVEQ